MKYKFYYIPVDWWVLLEEYHGPNANKGEYYPIKATYNAIGVPYHPISAESFMANHVGAEAFDFEAASLEDAMVYIFPYLL